MLLVKRGDFIVLKKDKIYNEINQKKKEK